MAVDEQVDKLLRTAPIEDKRLLRFEYKGGERIVEPHDYGIQKGSSACFAGKWEDKKNFSQRGA